MGNNVPILIVMLTLNDHTVKNAYDIFEQCKKSKAEYWGIKEDGLPLDKMKILFNYMKKCGKTTVLEVVAYTEEEGIKGAIMAKECGCDFLMGTMFYDSINIFCKENNIKYLPFVGNVIGRPSILQGTSDEMISDAKSYVEKGAYGIDLLGYRYIGNAKELNRQLTTQVKAPICIAGNIDSYRRLDEIKAVNPWAFTIGSAFFDNKFDGDFPSQIDKVYHYINETYLIKKRKKQ